ncbi:MAG: TIGR03557 family F420-dependent LLM class oxidoreductase [Actinomycetales bacterium]|nr:TIGR03557 family F420-dependent LLM class oxidoreductase [Actinomycetales bacterium]
MTAPVGFAAMLDRFAPAEAVELAAVAEQHGFRGVLANDHLQPWLPRHGQGGFPWSVLAAAGSRTTGELAAGPVTAGTRMHPAALAQAAATTAALHPGRHWIALGAGEAISEHVTGGYWPEAPERIGRMFEALEVVRKLFLSGQSERPAVHRGDDFRLESSRLWVDPGEWPALLVATAGPLTARRAGRVADGLLTIASTPERAEHLLARFDEGRRERSRGEGGRGGATRASAAARDGGAGGARGIRAIRIDLAWAPDDGTAMAEALAEWPIPGVRFPRADVRAPGDFEQLARAVRPEDLEGRMLVSSDLDAHRANIQRYLDLGFDRVFLHNAGPDQRRFLEIFGREVLPGLRA